MSETTSHTAKSQTEKFVRGYLVTGAVLAVGQVRPRKNPKPEDELQKEFFMKVKTFTGRVLKTMVHTDESSRLPPNRGDVVRYGFWTLNSETEDGTWTSPCTSKRKFEIPKQVSSPRAAQENQEVHLPTTTTQSPDSVPVPRAGDTPHIRKDVAEDRARTSEELDADWKKPELEFDHFVPKSFPSQTWWNKDLDTELPLSAFPIGYTDQDGDVNFGR